MTLWVVPVLALPALIPLARAYITAYMKGRVPTGFIQYDMACYMANAREHFDSGFQLFYGNPYAPYGTPAIYFQPHIFVLGVLQRAGLDPGVAFNLFGLAALLFTTWVAVRFYEHVVGLQTPGKLIGLLCFFWGGGILTIAATAIGLVQRTSISETLWTLDRAHGWWMFNFGRNLVYPTEAYYHGMFLLSLLFLMRRRHWASLFTAAVVSASHPFTGLSLALVLTAYAALELTLKSQVVPPWFLAGCFTILVAHLSYWVLFLNSFPDHRNLHWQLGWSYLPSTFVPVLFIVGSLAAIRLLRPPGIGYALKNAEVRLFCAWFLVIFALSEHNLIMRPQQPVHFARGYDWTALFFLSAPILIAVIDRLLVIRPAGLRTLAVGLLVVVLLLDNLVWFGNFLMLSSEVPQSISLTHAQSSVLKWLSRNAVPPEIVVCEDERLSYLVSTYTKVRSWMGHAYNTPEQDQRSAEVAQAFHGGRILPQWRQMRVYYVVARNNNWAPPEGSAQLFATDEFTIWGPVSRKR